MKTYKYICGMLLSLLFIFKANAAPGQLFYFEASAEVNTLQAPEFSGFQTWCQGICYPTTQFSAVDPVTGNEVAYVHIWKKDLVISPDGKTLCGNDFFDFKFKEGTVYAIATSSCGALLDPSLGYPVSTPGAVAISGGFTGDVVGGTKAYTNFSGQVINRLFIEQGSTGTRYTGFLYLIAK